MATRMQQRRGTAAEWTSANPVLGAGEIGFETDTNKFKIGDGEATWSSLPYFTTLDDIVDGAPGLLDTLNELAAAIGDDENFITTITSSVAEKLPLAGGIMTGDIVMSSGNVVLAGDPTLPTHAATKDYVDTSADAAANNLQELEESILETVSNNFPHIFVSPNIPTAGPLLNEDLQQGDLWYDNANGQLYVYYEYDTNAFYWVEAGGADENAAAALGVNSHDFPANPQNGDAHKGYIYDLSRTAWKIDRTTEIVDNADVSISSLANNDILMYNSTTSVFENVPGIVLDGTGKIPVSNIPTEVAFVADVPALNAKTTADWSTDTSTPSEGSINVELGTGVRLKIGDGVNTFANLEYVPSIASVDSQIAAGIADKADKASPTFTGTVSLPSDTSIGDVSAIEIGYLDGVTSSVQTQLNTLSSDKAPIANPTFTGTVSGVTKAMVDLGNVDNTADADKPVSTATQTALDAKADLAGATFTGNVEVDGNLVVDGDFTVNGTNFSASATSIVIEDNLIQLAHQNVANTVDLGIVVGYNDGATKHSGIVRDVSSDRWKLFKGVSTEPTTTVDFSEGSLDDLELNSIKASSLVLSDGTQTKVGVPSITVFAEKTASYTLDTLTHQDNIVEMNSSSPVTFTIPTDAALAWPVGASMDIFATGTGSVTIAGDTGVTVNATPGLVLRTQWSSATILKRAANTWVVYGDLKA